MGFHKIFPLLICLETIYGLGSSTRAFPPVSKENGARPVTPAFELIPDWMEEVQRVLLKKRISGKKRQRADRRRQAAIIVSFSDAGLLNRVDDSRVTYSIIIVNRLGSNSSEPRFPGGMTCLFIFS